MRFVIKHKESGTGYYRINSELDRIDVAKAPLNEATKFNSIQEILNFVSGWTSRYGKYDWKNLEILVLEDE